MIVAAAAGLLAGVVHVLTGPDHLAAVAPLSLDRQRPRWRAGFQWGLGHTAGVLTIGFLLVLFRQAIPIDFVSGISERLVGITLVIVGVWTFTRARSTQPHLHAAVGASFAMGALHGLAGSSHLFGILPALAFPTAMTAGAYLAGFGVGAVAAMTVFSALIGSMALATARQGRNGHRGLLYACSFSAFVTGGVWLVR